MILATHKSRALHSLLPFIGVVILLFCFTTTTRADRVVVGSVNYTGNVTEEAEGKLSTSGPVVVSSGSNVVFRASTSVVLRSGFTAELGSIFKAGIGTVAPGSSTGYTVTVNNGSPGWRTGLKTGDQFTIIANPSLPGSNFIGWVLVSGSGAFVDATASTTIFTVETSDAEVRAAYDGSYSPDIDSDNDGWSDLADFSLDLNPFVEDLTGARLGSSQTHPWPATLSRTEAVGATPGVLDVDPSGSAIYTLPIYTPPGINGVAPSLALRYSSNGANGLAGVGWSISGLSQITAGPTNPNLYPGIDSEHSLSAGLYMDGERLVLVEGTPDSDGAVYRTFRDNFTRVVLRKDTGTTPNRRFEVSTKSGLTLFYGTTDGSRSAGMWYLNEVRDLSGNYMKFTYRSSTRNISHHLYPDTIAYTGHGSRAPFIKIAFDYEDRPDEQKFYFGDLPLSILHRLDRIDVIYIEGASETLVRRYDLEYDASTFTKRSRLQSVRESGLDGSMLPETVFGWSTETLSFTSSATVPLNHEDDTVYFGEFNGDGRTDMLNVGGPTSRWARVHLSNGSAFGAAGVPWELNGDEAYKEDDILVGDLNGDGISDITGFFVRPRFEVAYLSEWVKHKYRHYVWIGNGTGGFGGPINVFSPVQEITYTQNQDVERTYVPRLHLIDYDGGGRASVFLVSSLSYGSGWEWTINEFDGSKFQTKRVGTAANKVDAKSDIRFIDANGDGRTDIFVGNLSSYYPGGGSGTGPHPLPGWSYGSQVLMYPEFHYSASGSVSTSKPANASETFVGYEVVTGDFDGDRISDVIALERRPSGERVIAGRVVNRGYDIRYSLYEGTTSLTDVARANAQGAIMSSSADWYAQKITVADLNRDGRDDLIVQRSNSCEAWFASPSGAGAVTFTFAGEIPDGPRLTETCFPIDINGDGRIDLFVRGDFSKGNTTKNCRVLTATVAAEPSDVITTVTDGLGTTTTVTYKPLTDSTVYTKGVGGPAGTTNVIAGAQVVRRVVYDLGKAHAITPSTPVDSGTDASYTVSYRYEGLRSVPYRGFIGFAAHEATDSRTQVTTRVERYQTGSATDAVLNGFVIKTLSKHDSILVSESIATPHRRGLNSGKTSFVFPQTVVNKTWALTDELTLGPETSHVTTTQTVDDWGNMTSVTTDFGFEGRTYVADIEYWPSDTANGRWLTGRTSKVSQTWSASDRPDVDHTTEIFYRDNDADPNNDTQGTPLLITKIVEFPDDPERKLSTVTEYTDGKGHANKVKATGRKNGTVEQTRSVEYVYDSLGRFVKEIKRSIKYNSQGAPDETFTETITPNQVHGAPATYTDWNGQPTHFEYDTFGRIKKVTAPNGVANETKLAWTTDPRGVFSVETSSKFDEGRLHAAPATFTVIDRIGRTTRSAVLNPDGSPTWTEIVYNGQGLIKATSTPARQGVVPADPVYWTELSYDSIGRQEAVTYPNGGGVTFSYDGLAVTSTRTGVYESVTTTQKSRAVFDSLGRILSIHNNEDLGFSDERDAVTYTYGATGEVIEVNSVGVVVSATYDARGYPLTVLDPNRGSRSFKHNAFGELYNGIRGTGNAQQEVTIDYDILGRVISRVEPEGTTSWVYDSAVGKGIGRLESVSGPDAADGTFSEAYRYETDLSRVALVTRQIAGQAFTVSPVYDAASRVSTVQYGSPGRTQRFAYLYGGVGALREIRDTSATTFAKGQTLWALMEANAYGQPISEYYGNGVRAWSGYRLTDGQLTDRIVSGNSQFFGNLSIATDSYGNLRRRQLIGGAAGTSVLRTETYDYDLLNRLTSVKLNGAETQAMVYASNGNITSKTGVGAYLYEGTGPHAASKAGATTYGYNAFGNLTHRNGAEEITWTSFDQPKRINRGGQSTFRYDTSGQRTQQAITGGETITYAAAGHERAFLAGANADRYHVHTPGGFAAQVAHGADGARSVYYFSSDQIGSLEAVIDNSGQPLESLSYDAWGKRRLENWGPGSPARSTSINRGFTGHEMLDHLGLVHMNGRVYDPNLARFLSADPIVGNPLRPQSYNRYAYVNNNPLNRTDPSGFTPIGPDAVFFAGSYDYDISGLNVYGGSHGNSIWSLALFGGSYLQNPFLPSFYGDPITVGAVTPKGKGFGARHGTTHLGPDNSQVVTQVAVGAPRSGDIVFGFVARGTLPRAIFAPVHSDRVHPIHFSRLLSSASIASLAILSTSGEDPINYNRRHAMNLGVPLGSYPTNDHARELLRNYFIPSSADRELVQSFYDNLQSNPEYARSLLNLMQREGRKFNTHHFLTNKHLSLYTPLFEAIVKRYGLSLDDNWNKAILPQNGSHPAEYHDWVFGILDGIDLEANGDPAIFLRLFEERIAKPVRDNPDMLYRSGWIK